MAWRLDGTWECVNLTWRLVEPIVGHDRAREALSCALSLADGYLVGADAAAHMLFRECRYVPDLDLALGRDRTRECRTAHSQSHFWTWDAN